MKKTRIIRFLYFIITLFFLFTLLNNIVSKSFFLINYNNTIIDKIVLVECIIEFILYLISLILFFKKKKYLIFFNAAILMSILYSISDFIFKIYFLDILKYKDFAGNLGYVSAFVALIGIFIYIVFFINKNEKNYINNEID